jgi:hypothetical protein
MEILTKGRKVLFVYYMEKYNYKHETASRFVEDFPFSSIFIPKDANYLFSDLFEAFHTKFNQLIETLYDPVSPLIFDDIKPFSLTYIDCDMYNQEGAIDNQFNYISNIGDCSSSNVIGHTNSNIGDCSSSNVIGHTNSNRGGQSSSSVGDNTELERIYLKEFGHQKIQELINRLRSNQKEFYVRMKAEGNNSLACLLHDIGFIFKDGVVKE